MNRLLLTTFGAGWSLALRNIRLQVREHLLGYAWTLITPMLYAVCFLLVKQSMKAAGADSWGFAFHAYVGMTLLQLWFQLLQDMAELVRRQRGVLRGLNVGLGPFVLALVFEGCISLVIRFAIVLVALIWLALPLPVSVVAWLWIAVAGGAVILSSAALGLVLAPWAALYGDVRKAIGTLTMPMALISPIFYPAVTHTDSPLYLINLVNPIASPLAVIADALADRPSLYTHALIAWIAVSIALLAWASRMISRQVPVLLERLGS